MGPEAAGGDPLPRPVSPPAVFEGQVRPQASALRCGDRAEGTPGVLLVSMTASCKNDPELVQKALCPSAIVTGASFNSYPPPPSTHTCTKEFLIIQGQGCRHALYRASWQTRLCRPRSHSCHRSLRRCGWKAYGQIISKWARLGFRKTSLPKTGR